MGTRPASRRRTSEAYRVRREAIIVARPFNEMIGGWQARIARLRTLAVVRGDGKGRDELAGEVARLARDVAAQRGAFGEAMQGLRADVVGSDRLTDTRRAMSTAVAALAEIQALLEGDRH